MIVGIGTSAGGIDALTRLFSSLPARTGNAYVVVQHLSPGHESLVHELLAKAGSVPVTQVEDGQSVELDHAYVCPPGVYVELAGEKLRLLPTAEGERAPVHAIDRFFRSIAQSAQQNAIGVVLSGNATDGAQGLRDIKAAGGFAVAQQPETATHPGMPEAAIATGIVDLVLTPEQMAEELPRIGRHEHAASDAVEGPAEPLERIFHQLEERVGVDFTLYKKATVGRRIQRRMAVRKTNDLAEYARIVEDDPDEAQSLFRDLLIHVTQFFREPESFQALKDVAIPEILGAENGRARIWVPGCATGEEAYTVAILVLEHLGARSDGHDIQIFATDLTAHEVDRARFGAYPKSIEADVSAERLERFFTSGPDGYRVSTVMRDVCVFARHDVIRDPPFSRLDLIVCRNLLIYLASALQERVMGTFHYALREGGYLMLGSSETVGRRADLFGIVDKKHRIYRRKPGPSAYMGATARGPFRPRPERATVPSAKRASHVDIDRYLADRYAPAALLVDGELMIVETRGRTGSFIELQPGEASLSLRKMIRPEIADVVGALLAEARESGRPARSQRVHLYEDGDAPFVDVEVVPLGPKDARCFLVIVEEPNEAGTRSRKRDDAEPERVAQLEHELASSRQYMHSMIQDLETTNEELQSANEEILSSNEELQSTNEELDTAREELQSTNEELNTVNDELHARNEELSVVNSDLTNLVASMSIAIVIVDRDLCIRRFTPEAERVLNLIPGDRGRPIVHVRPNVDVPELEALMRAAIDDVMPSEREVRSKDGRWFSLRIRPYKNQDNRIDGAVMSLVDIDSLKRYEADVTASRDYAEAIVQTVRHPLVVLDGDLRVVTTNRAFCDWFELDRRQTEGRLLAELDGGRWLTPELSRVLMEVLPESKVVESFVLEGRPPGGRPGRLVLNARRMEGQAGSSPLILVGMDNDLDRGGG